MEQEVFTIVGYQYGSFELKDGPHKGDMQAYASLFAVQPIEGEDNDKYHYCGSKALKFRCADACVLHDIQPGMNVNLFFDSKDRVSFIRLIPPAK